MVILRALVFQLGEGQLLESLGCTCAVRIGDTAVFTLRPVVQGDIILSINLQYKTIIISLAVHVEMRHPLTLDKTACRGQMNLSRCCSVYHQALLKNTKFTI